MREKRIFSATLADYIPALIKSVIIDNTNVLLSSLYTLIDTQFNVLYRKKIIFFYHNVNNSDNSTTNLLCDQVTQFHVNHKMYIFSLYVC